MTFGEKIRALREDMDLSQAQVAELIPMNQSNYSKIERGVQEPDLFQLKRIAEIFCVTSDELLGVEPIGDKSSKALLFADKVKELYDKLFKS